MTYIEECDWCGMETYCIEAPKPDGMPGDMCLECLSKEGEE